MKEIKSYCIMVNGGGPSNPPGPGEGGPGPGGGSGGGSGDWDGEDPGQDPGLPTDPNYEGGTDPCQSLESKINEPDFRVKLIELENSLNLNNEVWYANNTANQYIEMEPKERLDGSFGVDLDNTSVDIYGLMHTHFISDINMGVFSAPDIRAFMNLLRRREGWGPLNNTYCIVVGEHGTYALKLEDYTKFNNWNLQFGYNSEDGAKYKKYFVDMEKEYEKINEHPNTETDNEAAILELLNIYYGDLGIGIYKANDDKSGWKRMYRDDYGHTQFQPCN